MVLDELDDIELEKDNYYALAGAIIKSAMDNYADSYYHQLIGDKKYNKYNHPIYVDDDLKELEKFIYSGEFLIYAMDLVDPDYIIEQAKKIAVDKAKKEGRKINA